MGKFHVQVRRASLFLYFYWRVSRFLSFLNLRRERLQTYVRSPGTLKVIISETRTDYYYSCLLLCAFFIVLRNSHSSCCFRKTHARARVQFHVVLMRNQQQHLHINFHNHERRTATEYPYLPTYLPAYLPACLPACLPAYLPTYIHTYLPTYLHTYLPTY